MITDMPVDWPYTVHSELRLTLNAAQANAIGPLAQAKRWLPRLAGPTSADTMAEWEGSVHLHPAQCPGACELSAEVYAAQHASSGGHGHGEGRFNEWGLSGEASLWGGTDWQWSVGKKRVGWDVGYGFRPNDVVAQEARRTLLSSASEGRPVLQLERFWGTDRALSLVWANPQHAGGRARDALGADEAALAVHGYQRTGALDSHGFGRWGRHTGSSLGAAVAWVATDALELHASARLAQRHDAWEMVTTATTATGSAALANNSAALLSSNPWQLSTQGRQTQWLLGLSWTGTAQQSVLLEYWHDGSAPADAQWSAWSQRNQGLLDTAQNSTALSPVPSAAAGNLAWQTTPWNGAGPRRDNLLARVAWQPSPWQYSLDVLWNPADQGRSVTAALQWQGDQWRLQAAWRKVGGPGSAVLAQVPQRQVLGVSLGRGF